MTELLQQMFPEVFSDIDRQIRRATPVSSVSKTLKETRSIKIDVRETEDSYTISSLIPGYSKESISVEVDNGVLTISAKGTEKPKDLIYSEINNNRDIKRSFLLADDVDPDSITASSKDGILTLDIKKIESKKPQKIKIK